MSRTLIHGIFVSVLVFGTIGVPMTRITGAHCARGAEPALTWDSGKLRQIEDEYWSLCHTFTDSRDRIAGVNFNDQYGESRRLIETLFRRRLAESDVYQLAASCEVLPTARIHGSEFEYDLLAFLVKAFVDLGDREALVELLSKRCPSLIDWPQTIEFYLAFRGQDLDDPILILGDAYSKSESPEVRRRLASSIRRAFGGLGIDGVEDADFVANARQWYERERDQLVVNGDFWRNEKRIPSGAYEKYPRFYQDFPAGLTRELLFHRRASSEERPCRGGASQEFATPRRHELRANSLKGVWLVDEACRDGKPAQDVVGPRWTVTGEKLTWITPNGQERFRIRFLPGQPEAIDLIGTRPAKWDGVETTPLIEELLIQTIPAIYDLEDGMLRVCLGKPDAYRRPTSFDAFAGSERILVVLKRGSVFGPAAAAIGLVAIVLATALLFWPKRGLYASWRHRTRTGAPVAPANADSMAPGADTVVLPQ